MDLSVEIDSYWTSLNLLDLRFSEWSIFAENRPGAVAMGKVNYLAFDTEAYSLEKHREKRLLH
jgi:hypothetical protein